MTQHTGGQGLQETAAIDGGVQGITMTGALDILCRAQRPLDKAYAKDLFNVGIWF